MKPTTTIGGTTYLVEEATPTTLILTGPRGGVLHAYRNHPDNPNRFSVHRVGRDRLPDSRRLTVLRLVGDVLIDEREADGRLAAVRRSADALEAETTLAFTFAAHRPVATEVAPLTTFPVLFIPSPFAN